MKWPFFSQASLAFNPFNYGLTRKLVESAIEQTSKLLNFELSAILPYGFELLSNWPTPKENTPYWPTWPQRHYPAIGYPEHLSRDEAESIAHVFHSLFNYKLLKQYPTFHEKLKYIDVYQNGQYSRLPSLPEIVNSNHLGVINTMSIEIFPLKNSKHILDHYAHSTCCLFGEIFSSNQNSPEIREFDESKTRRNRLFQKWAMCEAMAKKALPNIPEKSEPQNILQNEAFLQLQIQNPTELIRIIQTKEVKTTDIEKQIRDELIFPRLDLLRSLLKNGEGKLVTLSADPYYNGKKPIMCEMNEAYANKMKTAVKQTYMQFPENVANYTKQSSEFDELITNFKK